ncbi:hypothetical protein ACR5KS_03005 [Leucobacter sp. W1153]|uniref:hypothetical protein n=1 Tax=Leucobacter sp. W1153 TaxID=3439064 RepID=UPI003F33A27F
MNTTTVTPANTEQLAYIDGILKTRQQVLADRIGHGSEKLQALIEAGAVAEGLPEEVLARYYFDDEHTFEDLYFVHCAEHPTPPVEAPEWAENTDLLLGEWPEINVRFTKEITLTDLGVKAELSQTVTITTEDSEDPDGNLWPKGHVYAETGAHFHANVGRDSISLDFADSTQLKALGEAIADLASALHRTEIGA